MAKISAGLMMYCIEGRKIKVFLGHVGGPFGKRDKMWGIPKGEVDNGNGGDVDIEDEKVVLNNAVREFEEEIGFAPKLKDAFYLGKVKRKNGRLVYVWAFQGNGREKFVKSNTVELEWPPKSGIIIKVLEIDDARYFTLEDAKKNMHKFQEPLIGMIYEKLKDKIVKEEKQRKLF